MTYEVEFISEYCCACIKTVQAQPVLVICSRISECEMKVGGYNVDSMLYLGRCRTSLVGQSARLLVPMSSVRFWQQLQKPSTYMDVGCTEHQARVLNYCFK